MRLHTKLEYHCRQMSNTIGRGRGLLVAALAFAACTKANPAATCSDGTCPDEAFPFCDTHGVISGDSASCIAVSCTPSVFAACDGDSSIVCNASGDNYDVSACAHGCSAAIGGCNECSAGDARCADGAVETCGSDGHFAETETCLAECATTPTPHCSHISPRFLPDICDVPAPDASFNVNQSGQLDSSLDANCNGGVVTQSGAPSLCVMHYGAISIDAPATLSIIGDRSIAFVADDDMVVSGTVDLGAKQNTNGPGGGLTTSGGLPTDHGGGGGAGFATSGGAGASQTFDGGALNAGTATANPISYSALVGGPRSTGGGGGAAAFISCRGRMRVEGTVTSGGGGGLGAPRLFGGALGGFGGGAGGYVVFQALDVVVTGEVYANGGGGGAGANASPATGDQNGADGGPADTVPAAGGPPQTGAGAGGPGGIRSADPQGGKHPSNSASAVGGGGGGSVGFFQTYTPAGVTPTLTPSHASPGFQPNATIPTR